MQSHLKNVAAATVLLAIHFVPSVQAFDCSLKPIYVDVHTRKVHELSSSQYGSFIGVGTPAQNLSLWPSVENNETSTASLDICNGSTDSKCGDKTGGLFSSSESTSFHQTPQHQSLDSTRSSNFTSGTDTLHLYTHFFEENGASDTPVPDLPISVFDSPPSFATPNSSESLSANIFSTVGLGPTSTLLQALYSQGKISSRSFGLYLGQAQLPLPSSENIAEVIWSANGSLTLGGYDSARFADPVTSFPLQEPSTGPTALKVQISGLSLLIEGNQNESSRDLLPANPSSTANSSISAYISTSSVPLVLPQAVVSSIRSAISGFPSTTSQKLSLTISSSSGPASYAIPFTSADLDDLVKPATSDSAPLLLGLPFLSAAYLTVSYDSATFYLAPVVVSAPYIIPQTVCPKTTPMRYIPPNGHGFSKQGLVGAILGGVIAGIALVGVAICSARSWRRRRAEKKVRFRLGEEEELGEEMREHRLRFWRRDRR